MTSATAISLTVITAGVGVLLSAICAVRWKSRRKWINLERHHPVLAKKRLDGCIVVITGANTGLGRVVAEQSAKRGAKVVLACRNIVAGNHAVRQIKQTSGNDNVKCMLLDLASLESVKIFARQLTEEFPKIDFLVCNAGVFTPMEEGARTADGYEIHFGINHLGHFLLVDLLKESLVRVVTVSSTMMSAGVVEVDSLDAVNGRKAGNASSFAPTGYCDSKLMNVMFTKELVKRNPVLRAYSVCPGWCKTDLSRQLRIPFYRKLCMLPFVIMFMRSADQGAQNITFGLLEYQDKLENGGFYRDGRLVPKENDRVNNMQEECQKLWDLSSNLVSLVGRNS